MQVTVAICTYRRFDRLKICLESLHKQSIPQRDYKILVIDNSLSPKESKNFKESLRGFLNLEYIITEKCGTAYARNEALKLCDTDLIAYTDDDCIVPSNWVENILSIFIRYSEGLAVVGGRTKPLWERTPPRWVTGSLLYNLALIDWGDKDIYINHESGKWLVTANAAYRVKALCQAGGFPERLGPKRNIPITYEEHAANQVLFSLGYDILYSPLLEVFHFIPSSRISLKYFYQHSFWDGVSRVLHCKEGISGKDTDKLADTLIPLENNFLKNIKHFYDIDVIEKNRQYLCEQGSQETNRLLKEKNTIDPYYTKAWPVIYIVTPCLNAAETIDKTIFSIITQDGDFTVRYHIQDCGSIDGTLGKLADWKKRINNGAFPIQCSNIVFTYSSCSKNDKYDALEKGFNTMSIPNDAFMTWIEPGDIFMPGALSYINYVDSQFETEQLSWLSGSVAIFKDDCQILQEERRIPSIAIKEGLCEGVHWHSIQQVGTFFRYWLWKKAIGDNATKVFSFAGAWNIWRIFAKYTELIFTQWPLGGTRLKDDINLTQKKCREEIDKIVSIKQRKEALRRLIEKQDFKVFQLQNQKWPSVKTIMTENEASKDAFYFYHKNFGSYPEKHRIIENNKIMHYPKVSVIVPFYKSIRFLPETIESVLAQTYLNWELLLVDDGSIDGSEQIAMNYVKQYPDKIKYLCHEGRENRGIAPSRNLGLYNAKGEYVATIDSDDIWLPDKLESHLSILNFYTEADALFGETLKWYSWTGNPGDQKKDFIWDLWKDYGIEPNTIVKPPRLLRLLLEFYVMPQYLSLVMRRTVLNNIGGWADEVKDMYDDQALYVKLFMTSKIFIASGCKEKHRIHSESITQTSIQEGNILSSKIRYLTWVKKYLSEQSFHDPQIEEYLDNELKPYQSLFPNSEVVIPTAVGQKSFGDLHQVTPISRLQGFDRGRSFERGQSIACYYCDTFYQTHNEDIIGQVLEVGSPGYTRQFNDGLVFAARMLNFDFSNEQNKSFISFISNDDNLARGAYDCVILSYVLMAVYDVQSAIKKSYESLRTGGVLLATLPGISQINRPQLEQSGDYWRFTDLSVQKLFGNIFGSNNITVKTYGNVLAASAALFGLSSDEIVKEELDFNDPDYQVIITVRAVKQKNKLYPIDSQNNMLTERFTEIEGEIINAKQELYLRAQELEEIKMSKAWKFVLFMRRIRSFILPSGSTRERFIRLMYRFITSPKHFMLLYYSVIKDLKLVKESGFFDETWYLRNNPDLAQTKLDPLKHFLLHGGFEGRDPGPNFSSYWYLEEYTDVKKAGINPLLHFLTHGRDEGRFPISQTEFKKNQNQDQDNMPTESKINYNAISNEQDLNSSNSNDQDLSLGNKVPAQILEHETSLSYIEIITTQNPEKASTLEDVRLFAVIGTWMEEDVIEATVQNAFTQGCEKVYLVDNDSSDNTVKIACENGAILAKSFASNQYNEEKRLFYMNSVMREVSEQEGEPHLWWLLLDADEFPHGPSGMTILKYIRTLDRQFRVIGSRFFDHYPNAEPAYITGRHPIDFQPLCEEISLPMCHSNHRKHQLLRYDKDSLNIDAGPGFHLVRCSEPLFEPVKPIFCHHFPFREKAATYKRLTLLWEKDKNGISRADPESNTTTHMLARMSSIEAVYNQDWESVVNFVRLDPMSDSLENKPEETGVHLKLWTESVPLEDQQVLRWYPMLNSWNYESLPEFNYGDDSSYIKGMAFLDGHGDIEDWGCGFGHAKQFIWQSKYIGIDGSSPSADKRVDLSSYTANADCIFIRHVLEHNTNWAKILKNAVSSFRKRMVLIIFTPFSETTRILCTSDILTNFPVPDISFSRLDLMAYFEDLNVNEEAITSDTQYGVEYIFYLEK